MFINPINFWNKPIFFFISPSDHGNQVDVDQLQVGRDKPEPAWQIRRPLTHITHTHTHTHTRTHAENEVASVLHTQ